MNLSDKVLMELIKKKISETESIFLPNFYMHYNATGTKWEADLFQLTKNNFTIEYEVKVYRSDLKKDFLKTWWSYDKSTPKKHDCILNGMRSNRFYFVIPGEFTEDKKIMEIIPDKYGIITYELDRSGKYEMFKYYRKAKLLHKNKTKYREFVIKTLISKYNYLYIKYIKSQQKIIDMINRGAS